MRLLRLSILLHLLFCTVVHAETGQNWIGFKQEADAAVPPAVVKAASSVFQILYAHGVPEVKDVSNIDIKTMSTAGNEWFKIVQVKVCQIQKIKNCPILPKMFTGTTFLVKDQQTIATNLHNIQAWLYYAKKFNPELSIENIQAPILLADKNQNLVFNPMDGQATLKLSFYNKSPATFSEEYPWDGENKKVFFRVSDYVELHASIQFQATPLKIGKIDNIAEQLYAIGFPNPTAVFAKYGGTDSPGYDRWVSTGALRPTTSLENINISANIAGAPGSSGSPLLKQNGEVVGILFSGAISETEGTLVTVSQYLQINFMLMKQAWNQFKTDGELR